jgi:hypothetical protein
MGVEFIMSPQEQASTVYVPTHELTHSFQTLSFQQMSIRQRR